MEVLVGIVAGSAIFLLLTYAVRAYGVSAAEVRLKAISAVPNVTLERSADGVSLLRTGPSGAIVSRVLSASAYSEKWQFQLERADVKLRASEYFLLRVMLAALTVLVITAIGQNALAFIVSLPLGAIMYMAPALWLGLRTQRRIQAIDTQLVEAITLIANALRAGFAFSQGIDVAAKRMGPPISVEMGRMLVDVSLGKSTEEALNAMNERVGSEDMDMMVTAILIQRNSGGNLAEVLENVAETMRDRERIKGEIKTLTSSQRLTAWILSLWPVCVAAMFFLINPGIMSLMWTTTPGLILLGIWAALNLMGVIALQRILAIDI